MSDGARCHECRRALSNCICGKYSPFALKIINRLKAFARDLRDNYDCDKDSHKYGTACRKCEAKHLLHWIRDKEGTK